MSECKRSDCSLSAAAVSVMRETCWRGLGMNCTFVDDDMSLLVTLAQRAVLAGLDTDADDDTRRRMREASEPNRAGHEQALGFEIARASRDTQPSQNEAQPHQAKPQKDASP